MAYVSSRSLRSRRANASRPAETIPRRLAEFLLSVLPALHAAAAARDDQGLAERMGMPRCSSAGLERDIEADSARRSLWLKQGIYARRAGKPVGRSYAGLV